AFFFSSRRRHTRFSRDWSSDVCSSDLDWSSTSLTSALSVRQRETPSSQSRRAARDAASASSYEDSRAATARLFGGGGEGIRASRSEERRVGKEGSSARRASSLNCGRQT